MIVGGHVMLRLGFVILLAGLSEIGVAPRARRSVIRRLGMEKP